jgi:hypothetical protein
VGPRAGLDVCEKCRLPPGFDPRTINPVAIRSAVSAIPAPNLLCTSPYFERLRWVVVSMLASGTHDRGFAPGRSRRIFSGEKILGMPSFGREVKPFAPCCRFAACQRPL